MAKSPLHVVPHDGGWKVQGGTGIKHSTHRKKSAAVERAKKVGRHHDTGVVVHRKDGTVQYGYTCDTSGARTKLVRST